MIIMFNQWKQKTEANLQCVTVSARYSVRKELLLVECFCGPISNNQEVLCQQLSLMCVALVQSRAPPAPTKTGRPAHKRRATLHCYIAD